jgi:hypothetical protein
MCESALSGTVNRDEQLTDKLFGQLRKTLKFLGGPVEVLVALRGVALSLRVHCFLHLKHI